MYLFESLTSFSATMSSVQRLQEFISGRLVAAVADIFSEFENAILRYEEEIDRQRRLLDLCCKPELKLHRVDLRQEWVKKMDLILTNQQPSVDQEEPGPLELKIVQIRGGWTEPELPQNEEQMEPEPAQIKKECEDPGPAQFESLKNPEPVHFEYFEDPEPEEFEYFEDPEPEEFEYFEDQKPAEFENQQELCTNQEEDRLHLNQGTGPDLNEEKETEADVERLISQSSAGPEAQDQDSEPIKKKTSCERGSLDKPGPPGCVISRTNKNIKRCVLCGRGFRRWQQLSSHYQSHRLQGQLVGNISVQTLRDKPQCVAGTSPAAGEIPDADRLPLLCSVCGLELPNPSKLACHLRSHSVEHSCQTCGKGFPTTKALEDHSQTHVADMQLHQCPTCRKAYARRCSLTIHMRVHTRKKPYSCQTCGKKFSRGRIFRVHMKNHNKRKRESKQNAAKPKRPCPTCGKLYTSRSGLLIHTRFHTGEKPYSCQICGETFAYNQALRHHMKSLHHEMKTTDKENVDKREHPCPFCAMAFSNRSKLVIHVRSHTGERPFSCSECEKKFISNRNLKLHMKTHTGGKPFGCTMCAKTFTCNGSLKIHTRIHTGEKPYSCQLCEKAFMYKCQLKAHMKAH